MTSPPDFTFLGSDITPLLVEAYEKFRPRLTIDLEEFSHLAFRACFGPYIRAHEWKGRDRATIEEAAHLVSRWAHSLHRIPQIQDPGIQSYRPFVALQVGHNPCAACSYLRGRWIHRDELVRLPIDGCDNKICTCGYYTYSHRHLARIGWNEDAPGPPT